MLRSEIVLYYVIYLQFVTLGPADVPNMALDKLAMLVSDVIVTKSWQLLLYQWQAGVANI